MLTYTGDYIEHIDDNKSDFKYYTFAPRPLMYGDMYKIDNKLCSLLIETHRNIGFLEGLLKYAPIKMHSVNDDIKRVRTLSLIHISEPTRRS